MSDTPFTSSLSVAGYPEQNEIITNWFDEGVAPCLAACGHVWACTGQNFMPFIRK